MIDILTETKVDQPESDQQEAQKAEVELGQLESETDLQETLKLKMFQTLKSLLEKAFPFDCDGENKEQEAQLMIDNEKGTISCKAMHEDHFNKMVFFFDWDLHSKDSKKTAKAGFVATLKDTPEFGSVVKHRYDPECNLDSFTLYDDSDPRITKKRHIDYNGWLNIKDSYRHAIAEWNTIQTYCYPQQGVKIIIEVIEKLQKDIDNHRDLSGKKMGEKEAKEETKKEEVMMFRETVDKILTGFE